MKNKNGYSDKLRENMATLETDIMICSQSLEEEPPFWFEAPGCDQHGSQHTGEASPHEYGQTYDVPAGLDSKYLEEAPVPDSQDEEDDDDDDVFLPQDDVKEPCDEEEEPDLIFDLELEEREDAGPEEEFDLISPPKGEEEYPVLIQEPLRWTIRRVWQDHPELLDMPRRPTHVMPETSIQDLLDKKGVWIPPDISLQEFLDMQSVWFPSQPPVKQEKQRKDSDDSRCRRSWASRCRSWASRIRSLFSCCGCSRVSVQ
ncbi:uncharacterized protein [Hyperolius riggenbachi]|uniref:uncharacterized protein isoform X2 n=1 Tax=Hyperolius riggenbachi TaxID=752182 RepID=UPI0035A34406